jgi:adenylate cyclase
MARGSLPKSVKKLIPVIVTSVITVSFLTLAFFRRNLNDVNFLTRVEYLWMDAKFRMRKAQTPGNDVVLVGVDAKTLKKLGSARVFKKTNWATLVDKLSAAKPKVIGFDILFSDVDVSDPANDEIFAESIKRAGNVVLGIALQLQSQTGDRRPQEPLSPEMLDLVVEKQVFPAVFRPPGTTEQISSLILGQDLELALPSLMKACASFGFVNFHRDAEGGLRYQPQFIEYGGRLYPSLDLQLLKLYFDAPSTTVRVQQGFQAEVEIGNLLLPTDPNGRYMLNFDGPRGTHETISMIDVMEDKVPPETFKDKIVVIGSPALGLADVVTSPFDPALPGFELHANVIDNVIQGRFLQRTETTKIIDLSLIVLFGVLLGFFLPRINASRSITMTVVLFALFTVTNIAAFLSARWVLGFVYPGFSLVATSFVLISYKYMFEERAKKETRRTFQYYLDQHVIEQVMNQPEMLKLGGEKRQMSVLFSDIRGFTSFSEKMSPTDVVQFLNQYFDRMTGLIFQYKGTLDKLIGDAVMCFWGHPVETKDHAVRATVCALEMIQAVEDLRSVLVLPGGAKFEIGIGINTGAMVVGNMGSQTRFSYTVMGDNVNLGSRLESLNKYYGTRILISDATYEECKHLVFCRQLDTIQVKGKSQAVTIYEPLGLRRLSPERRHLTDRRNEITLAKKIKKAYVTARFGERRLEERRMGSPRILLKPEHEEIATIYEHALSLYRSADFDAADRAFDHVLSLNPSDGPSRLMKSRISKYRMEYAGATTHFDPVYKFDEK